MSEYRIYTSYFSNLANLPKDAVLVSIANSQPKGLHLPTAKIFVPDWSLVSAYKRGEINEEEYHVQYLARLQSLPNLPAIRQRLATYTVDRPESLIFLCWESKGKFCHRHILAEFFSEFGIREYGDQ